MSATEQNKAEQVQQPGNLTADSIDPGNQKEVPGNVEKQTPVTVVPERQGSPSRVPAPVTETLSGKPRSATRITEGQVPVPADRQTPVTSANESEATTERDIYQLPSNQDYLSYYVYQNEWRPTRPLRAIGAISASPGPATVTLPSTMGDVKYDLTKPRAPSYKMGQRLARKETTTGPGPGMYDVNGICKVTNSGKESNLAPKIGKAARFREKDRVSSQSPGPAAYNRDPGDKLVFPSAPSFSMAHSQRMRQAKMSLPTTPGPNAYSLPTAIGPGTSALAAGPSFSMGKAKRMPDTKQDMNPGPAAYVLPSTNVNMSKSPGFYMGLKTEPLEGDDSSPGPGAYYNHMVKFDKFSTPRITFGIRHSPFKIVPGFDKEM